jgi:hypothetical protein
MMETTAIAAPNLQDAGGLTHIRQGGYNTGAGANDDVWYGDGAYNFLVANSSIVALASTANDTAAGLGCKTIKVEGLDGSYNYQTENLSLTGTTSVSLANSYIRVNNAYCLTTGSLHTNNGDIMLMTTALAPVAIIASSTGRVQQAVYTAPNDKITQLEGWDFSVGATSASVALQVRELSSAWTTVDVIDGANGAGVMRKLFGSWVRIPRKADVRLRVIGIGAGGNPRINGSLEVMQK